MTVSLPTVPLPIMETVGFAGAAAGSEEVTSPEAEGSSKGGTVKIDQEDVREVPCFLCKRFFRGSKNLKIHEEKRLREKIHCRDCSEHFCNRSLLARHIACKHRHSKTAAFSHQCGFCHQSFVAFTELTQHHIKHHSRIMSQFEVQSSSEDDDEDIDPGTFLESDMVIDEGEVEINEST